MQQYNEAELLSQLAEIDPDFQYHNYVDGNCTLQEVISIRQCFLDLRSDFDNQDEADICGTAVNHSTDPAEMVQARKLRSIPFLTNDDIMRISMPNAEAEVHVDESQASEPHDEDDKLNE